MKRILMANYQIKTYIFVGRSLSSKLESMGFKLIQNSMHMFEIRYYFSCFENQITVIKIISTLRQLWFLSRKFSLSPGPRSISKDPRFFLPWLVEFFLLPAGLVNVARLRTQVYFIKPDLWKGWSFHSLSLWLEVLQYQIALLAKTQGSSVTWGKAITMEMKETQKSVWL